MNTIDSLQGEKRLEDERGGGRRAGGDGDGLGRVAEVGVAVADAHALRVHRARVVLAAREVAPAEQRLLR